MSLPEIKERVSLVEQRQDYIEEKVIKHMQDEDKRNEEIKNTQTKIFEKIDSMQECVTKNTIDNAVGIKSIKSTVVIVGSILSIIFGALGLIVAFTKVLS